MKTTPSHIIFCLLALLMLASCTRDIPYKGPEVPPELVANAFFQPDSVFHVHLSLTQNIVSNEPVPVVNDAMIWLLNADSTLIEQLTYKSQGNYQSTNTAQTGKPYILKIAYNGKLYWSADSTPSLSPILSVDTTTTIFQGNPDFFRIRVTFKDNIQQKNYYKIYTKRYIREYIRDNNGIITDSADRSDILELESSDFLILDNEASKYSKKELLFTDRPINGSTYTLAFGTFSIRSSNKDIRTLSVNVVLESLSAASYNYTSTLNEHLFFRNDPFSQPVNVQGNINGGYGIFGGYTLSEKVILFK